MLIVHLALENRYRNELRNKYPTLSYIPCEVQRGLYLWNIQTE